MLLEVNLYDQLLFNSLMTNIKNISSALSVATTMLLGACSSDSTDSGPAPVANTAAPQLIGSWQSNCVTTQSGTSTTVTQASGGSSSGGVSGGEAFRNRVIFNQDGRVEFITEDYATSNCNVNTLANVYRYNAVYFIGESTLANDSSQATEIDYSDSSSTTYSIFQIVNNTELYLGDGTSSSPGNDGNSEAARFDGLGPEEMLKQ